VKNILIILFLVCSLNLMAKDDHSHAAPGAHSHAKAEEKGVEPAVALGLLRTGNQRFIKGSVRHDGQSAKDIERLSKGQKPHTIILSCSDSRVPPELVFDQKLGEIFIIRTAGETLEANVIGSIEYAVEHLSSKLIVVMGHTSCGAVKAAIGSLDGSTVGSPSLDKLVADIHPRIRSTMKDKKEPSKEVLDESWANAKGAAEDLVTRSAILKKKLESGDIEIRYAMYNLNNGKVEFK
jgi:carbonic anhydrase